MSDIGELEKFNDSLDTDAIKPEEVKKEEEGVLDSDNSDTKEETESSEKKTKSKKKTIIAIFAIALVIVCSVILIINASIDNKKDSSSSDSSYSYQMDHSLYCLLYMNISNVEVEHKGSYAYVSGTITNNGTYQIKYVKVRAACKDYSGSTIDTDWTYAVDSSWLNPGESKRFEMMIKDEDYKIKTVSVSVVSD